MIYYARKHLRSVSFELYRHMIVLLFRTKNYFLFFLILSPFFRAPLRVEDTPHTPEKFKAQPVGIEPRDLAREHLRS